MKANNLTVSIPQPKEGPRCDKNCLYCISLMTQSVKFNYDLFFNNLDKAKYVAQTCSVSSILLTSNGEPCLNYHLLLQTAMKFSSFPMELQTNGLWLFNHKDAIKELQFVGLDTLAFSVDNLYTINELYPVFKFAHDLGMTVRVCLNLSNKITPKVKFVEIIASIKGCLIDQLLLRQLTIPDKTLETEESKRAQLWIKENVDASTYIRLYQEFQNIVDEKDLIRILPHGVMVYNVDNITVTFSDYCIQEYNNTEDIRSLIYLEDGHLYTSWDKISSRLF